MYQMDCFSVMCYCSASWGRGFRQKHFSYLALVHRPLKSESTCLIDGSCGLNEMILVGSCHSAQRVLILLLSTCLGLLILGSQSWESFRSHVCAGREARLLPFGITVKAVPCACGWGGRRNDCLPSGSWEVAWGQPAGSLCRVRQRWVASTDGRAAASVLEQSRVLLCWARRPGSLRRPP